MVISVLLIIAKERRKKESYKNPSKGEGFNKLKCKAITKKINILISLEKEVGSTFK